MFLPIITNYLAFYSIFIEYKVNTKHRYIMHLCHYDMQYKKKLQSLAEDHQKNSRLPDTAILSRRTKNGEFIRG